MSNNKNDNRIRLLAIERILYLNADGINVNDIIFLLESEFNISSCIDTIYDDIKALSLFYHIKPIKLEPKGLTYKLLKEKGTFEKWNKLKLIF